MSIVKLKATDGTDVQFDDGKVIGQGGMKDVYFSPDKSYVVGFFREKQDVSTRDRLNDIVGRYREKIFNQIGGEYWKQRFCWPTKLLEDKGRIGVVCPTYAKNYFFQYGAQDNTISNIIGKEKEGLWFASALNYNRTLDPRERGEWKSYFIISLNIARAVRRMHAAGLAHSDLSYKNVLIDPSTTNASIIDIDGLVVPGKYPPGVVGTPDFIAPEVVQTQNLPLGNPKKQLPSTRTDQHALAVLIYMYLLHRHPLRGRQVHDLDDTANDETLTMGEKALFIENPKERGNWYDLNWLKRNEDKRTPYHLPWRDLAQLPYKKTLGPYLAPLCDRAFIEGLRNPLLRPTADDWEQALLRTVDSLVTCENKKCPQKWFVFDYPNKPVCPFCKTPYTKKLPVLHLYYKRGNSYIDEKLRLMVYDGQHLHLWHANRNICPNEKLTEAQKPFVGYFVFHQGKWCLQNQSLPSMFDQTDHSKPGGTQIMPGKFIELTDGAEIVLAREEGGRLVRVQLVN